MASPPVGVRPLSRFLPPLFALLALACPAVCGVGVCGTHGCGDENGAVAETCDGHGHDHHDGEPVGEEPGGDHDGCPAGCGGCFCDGAPVPADGPDLPAVTLTSFEAYSARVEPCIAGVPAGFDREDRGSPPGRCDVCAHAGLLL